MWVLITLTFFSFAAHASPPQGISLRSLELEETSPHVLNRGLRLPAQTELTNSSSCFFSSRLCPLPPISLAKPKCNSFCSEFKLKNSPCINSYAHGVFFLCVCVSAEVQCSQAMQDQARSSADKASPLVDCDTTCYGRWCDIQPLSTEEGKQGGAQEDKRDSDGGQRREKWKRGGNQVRIGASVRDTKERFDVESERHHVDHVDLSSGLSRASQRRLVIDFPHSQQNDFAMQGKYTASHSNFSKIHTYMHGHTLITKSPQSFTWQRHTNRFSFPLSHTKQHALLTQMMNGCVSLFLHTQYEKWRIKYLKM